MQIEFSPHETNVMLAAFEAAYLYTGFPPDAKDQMALVRMKVRNAQAAASQALAVKAEEISAEMAVEKTVEPGPSKPDQPKPRAVKQ